MNEHQVRTRLANAATILAVLRRNPDLAFAGWRAGRPLFTLAVAGEKFSPRNSSGKMGSGLRIFVDDCETSRA